MSTVTDYLATLDGPSRSAFEQVAAAVRDLVPDAGEGTSYGMAALTYRGKPLLGFRAAKGHLSVFPFSPAAVDAARPELDGYELSKGTVRFTADRALPRAAVRLLIETRLAEIDG